MDLFVPVAQLAALGLSYFAHGCDQNHPKRETLISFHVSRAQPIRHSSRSLRQLVAWQPESGNRERQMLVPSSLSPAYLVEDSRATMEWNDAACM